MQNVGNGSYAGDLESASMTAAGRSEGPESYNEDGKATDTAHSDYAARAAMTNNQPRG